MGFLPKRIHHAACLAFAVLATLLVLQIFTYHQNATKSDDENMMKNKPDNAKLKAKIKPSPTSKAAHIDFMKNQTSVQSKRKVILQETCKRRGLASEKEPPLYTKTHTLVVDNFKVIYCFVPKVENSNWKRIMMVLNGEKDTVEGLTSEEVHVKAKTRFLNSYTPEEQQHRLKNYRKFFFVREPLERIMSVYRDQFENTGYYRVNKPFHVFGKQMVRKFKKKPSAVAIRTGENATWTEFVDYLTHPLERAEIENELTSYPCDHWKEMHNICSPCTVDYDVIGKLETIHDDAKYVLKLIDAPGKVKYIASSAGTRPTNSSDDGTFQKYLSQLDKKKLTQLWDLYKLDYELFGYPKPAIIPD
ncbi:carbohydrate sulfotransferase 11-like [Asterias rubens]|uniref:carbohydrate sulfotransferase 11-like n=1 Tax=Asterias rubens TaxID=7604 RepID=UPI001455D187|nr:carbohydrate sulfotransferase 11-like [Asterias rubens]